MVCGTRMDRRGKSGGKRQGADACKLTSLRKGDMTNAVTDGGAVQV